MTAARAPGHGVGNGSGGFAHTALIIDSDDDLRNRLVPELRRLLPLGEAVLMVVSRRTAEVVRAALGPVTARLEWADRRRSYQRLGRAYETFRRHLAERHAAGSRVHLVAEPDIASDRTGDLAVDRAKAYLSYESVCNEVYAPYRSPVTCIWDSRRHPATVLDAVRRVHTHELTASGGVGNPHYLPPARYLAGGDTAAVPPPRRVDLDLPLLHVTQLGLLRTALRLRIEEHRFEPHAADDIMVAVSEVATNGLVHGAAPVRVRAWLHHDTLVVQVDDAGGTPIPAAAGFYPPARHLAAEGRGLWLARQLADVVTVHATGEGTAVRLFFPRDVMHRDPGDAGRLRSGA